ncbi:glycosyltransferase family 4 protein [Oceanobacillus profundus]|uniref:glycosyltransferase family 4 protein n=1 Tax=Oceanobacillus profundus TaxID=372463 RepID=UPI0026E2F3DF|nr:glycosyltransferase family 4 protein [Oceanobacillus profundus]MDO6450497.1 glycosyltransferase family 4 protein [Oceanobacillus profundus]
MKAKILQLCAVSTTVDKQLKPLIDRSIEEGYEVHIVCTNDGNLDNLKKQGYIIHEVNIDRKINLKSNIKSIRDIYNIMRKENYDIVHVHTPVASIIGRLAAKLAGVKNIIYTAHGYYFHEGMSKRSYNFFYRIEKYFAKFATDYLLLQSREDYELSLNHRFKEPGRIIRLGNGVDIYNKFNPDKISAEIIFELKKRFDIKKEDTVFAFIGRLVREKGIYELIEAFNKVNKVNQNMKLLLIGGLLESERDKDIQNTLDTWKSNKNIIFTGVRSDIDNLLAISDVFILPSYREGLPRSIIEAMAMKKPVIATNIRGCREEVIHERTGYLVEKQNVEEIYLKMTKLTDNKSLRISMGNEARKIVEKEYDEEEVLNKQIDLFNSLL